MMKAYFLRIQEADTNDAIYIALADMNINIFMMKHMVNSQVPCPMRINYRRRTLFSNFDKGSIN
jgi:hypothetical protein